MQAASAKSITMQRKPSIINDIPQEVLIEISSHLYPDTSSLKALAHTSQAWRAPAQRFVFARLVVRGDGDPAHAPPGRRTADLLALLQRAPHLAGYVTHLVADERHADADSRPAWDAALCALLPLFGALTRLALVWAAPTRDTMWACPLSGELVDLVKATLRLPQLAHVELTRAPLSWLRCLGPRVESLALWNPHIDIVQTDAGGPADSDHDNINGIESTDTGASQGRMLIFSHVRPEALLIDGLDWAACHQVGDMTKILMDGGMDVSRLRKLGLGLISSPKETHAYVAELLRACGSTLQELSLTPSFASYAPGRDAYPDAIDLRVLPRLRVLHISAQAGIVQNQVDVEPALWLLARLKRMPRANALETVILSVEHTVFETVDSRAYFGLDFASYGALERRLVAPDRFPRFRMFIAYTEDPRAAPTQKLLFWIARSMAQHTRSFAQRNAFSFKYGGLYRPQLFPDRAPW